MDSAIFHRETDCHVVAVPYPGRGHVNPMMNLCKLLTSKKHDILITVVATEEWIGLIASNYEACQIRFASIPNVIPSELVRGADFPGFYEAVMTKMAELFELLLDQLELPVTTIISDSELLWAIRIGNKRNIPVATLCTVPATVFSVFHHFRHLHNQEILVNLLENEDEMICDVQGISSTHLADLRAIFHGYPRRVVQLTLEGISWVPKAQFLLFNSVYELETHVFDALKEKFNLPIYPIGPAISFLDSFQSSINSTSPSSTNYFQWLDSQAAGTVLYVSFGSYIAISREQMDEIAAGLRNSSVPYLWISRGETTRLKDTCGDKGMVMPWCDQLKVLCHSAVGGFWTHCGWNSTLEAIFSGVPMLTLPLYFDPVPNSKQIVEKWMIGRKLMEDSRPESLVLRDKITDIVKRFMDRESSELKEMRKQAKGLQEIIRSALEKGGSSDKNLDAFIRHFLGSF